MAEPWLEVSLAVTGWYLTSFGTLLLNKYLLGTLYIEPDVLACVQMVSTAIYGALKTVRWSTLLRSLCYEVWPALRRTLAGTKVAAEGAEDLEDPKDGPKPAVVKSWKRACAQMGFVGAMRFATVVLGLVSLKNIAASFTETIKASAPFFTVIIAFLMLGERTSLRVVASLVPVALGLVLASSAELSFNVLGFSAAVATNVIECVQNVFSKRLLAVDYTASQLQFYTSLTALVLQAPIFLYRFTTNAGPERISLHQANATEGAALEPQVGFEFNSYTIGLLWIDGVLYHLQSVVAYVVMSYLSPVTVSVVNTIKRAIIIMISVLVFHNQVTPGAAIGTAICLSGALCYNVARQQPGSALAVASASSPDKKSASPPRVKDKK